MTSSLSSRFDFVDRRALFLAGDKLIVHHWRGGALADFRGATENIKAAIADAKAQMKDIASQ